MLSFNSHGYGSALCDEAMPMAALTKLNLYKGEKAIGYGLLWLFTQLKWKLLEM